MTVIGKIARFPQLREGCLGCEHPAAQLLSSPVSPGQSPAAAHRYPGKRAAMMVAECGWYRGRCAFVPFGDGSFFYCLKVPRHLLS